ncbi:MAG: ATP-binding protein [Kiritimatiellia bacterium]|nr:ATP-binding protein [Kiritimatiellia bacterium]
MFNKRFGEMWQIPRPILDDKDDVKMLECVASQLKDAAGFREEITCFHKHPDKKSRDEIELADGRYFDRYSSPLMSGGGKCYGRILYFRDITETKKTHKKLQAMNEELRLTNEELQIARDHLEKTNKEKEKEFAATAVAAATDRKRAAELEKAYRELKSIKEELAQSLSQSEKLASIGRLAAGVAHEINNPLATIQLGARRLNGMIHNRVSAIPDLEAQARILEKIANATNRCTKIVAGLLVFARPNMFNLGPTDINKIIEEFLDSLAEQVVRQNVKVVKDFAPHLPAIAADGHRLGQVFVNIITNACDAMPAGGELRIATRLQAPMAGPRGKATGKVDRAESAASPAVEIEFSDTGEGIEKENLFRIFDPFVTTKEIARGVGLGLSISYGIVKDHGGSILVASEKGKGTTFIVRLPVFAANGQGPYFGEVDSR